VASTDDIDESPGCVVLLSFSVTPESSDPVQSHAPKPLPSDAQTWAPLAPLEHAHETEAPGAHAFEGDEDEHAPSAITSHPITATTIVRMLRVA
jgi:hypothetical protein